MRSLLFLVALLVGSVFNTAIAQEPASSAIPPPPSAEDIQAMKESVNYDTLPDEQKAGFEAFVNQTTKRESVLLATVNIVAATVVKQEGHTFDLSFVVSNREFPQRNIVYAVNLFKELEGGALMLMDQTVYHDDSLSIGEHQKINKTFSYTAPTVLDGEYMLGIEMRNPEGMILGLIQIPEKIQLDGELGMKFMLEACQVVVSGVDETFSLMQGVDVAATEELTLQCDVQNSLGGPKTVTPMFETYYRTSFGDLISTVPGQSFTLNEGTNSLSLVIPKVKDPQAYDVKVKLYDEAKNVVSTTLTLHYVLRGPSATVQTALLDKAQYTQGETASIRLFWTAAADSFPDARLGATDVGTLAVHYTIVDQNGALCANPQVVSSTKTDDIMQLSAKIEQDCVQPVVLAKIVDERGTILANNLYDAFDAGVFDQTVQATIDAEEDSKPITLLSIMAGIIVLMLIYALFLKYKGTNVVALFIIMVGLGVFTSPDQVMADSWVANGGGPSYYTSLSPASIVPSSAVTATIVWVNPWCANGGYTQLIYMYNYDTASYMYSTALYGLCQNCWYSRSHTFTSSPTPGTHSLGFYTRSWDADHGSGDPGTWHVMNYSVIQPNRNPANPTVTPVPTGYIGRALTYSAVTATDEDNDFIQYGFDWNFDGAVDEWTGFSAVGVLASINHTWAGAAGNRQFQVIARDSQGGYSGWVSSNTNLLMPDPPTFDFDISQSYIDKGGSIVVSWGNVTDADQGCVANSNPAVPGWSGPKSVAGGSETVVFNTEGTYTLSLSCSNANSTQVTTHDHDVYVRGVTLAVPTSCTMAVGDSGCSIGPVTWSSANTVGTNRLEVNGTDEVPNAGPSGTYTHTGATPPNSPYVFRFYDSNGLLDTKQTNVLCTSGSLWFTGAVNPADTRPADTCQIPSVFSPTINITLDYNSDTVRSGETVEVNVITDTGATNAYLVCSIRGAHTTADPNDSWVHNGTHNEHTIVTKQLTASQVLEVTCVVDGFGLPQTTKTATSRIDVVGSPQEI